MAQIQWQTKLCIFRPGTFPNLWDYILTPVDTLLEQSSPIPPDSIAPQHKARGDSPFTDPIRSSLLGDLYSVTATLFGSLHLIISTNPSSPYTLFKPRSTIRSQHSRWILYKSFLITTILMARGIISILNIIGNPSTKIIYIYILVR